MSGASGATGYAHACAELFALVAELEALAIHAEGVFVRAGDCPSYWQGKREAYVDAASIVRDRMHRTIRLRDRATMDAALEAPSPARARPRGRKSRMDKGE